MNNKPNLFLVGAMKSATTSLHNYLDLHPSIFMAKAPWKEPRYFVKELNYKKGELWYLELFKDADSEIVVGESSTDYTKSPHYPNVPGRIHQFAPNAKIIYIMRGPIERAISHYWWGVEYSAEGRNIVDGILHNDWIMNTSFYAMQIEPYLDSFGFDNVYTLTTEALQKAPKAELKKIYSWLGVDENIKIDKLTKHNISKSKVNRVIGSGLFSKLKGTFIWYFFKKMIKGKLRIWLLKTFSKEIDKEDPMEEEVKEKLRPIMRKQVAQLSKLLNREFPEWKTLNGVE